MTYKARLTEPSYSNKYYIHTSSGGLNGCIKRAGGSCLPNCVGYAWGRAYEILESKPKLSRGNAENWYGYNDGYKRGKTPKVGAIACWRKGSSKTASDGAGHVAVVEQIKVNGDVVTSNSNYSGTRFYLKTYLKGNMYLAKNYTFQGFIYLPIETDEIEKKEDSKSSTDILYKFGDKNEYIGKVASFMRRVFPLYTSKNALGNLLGKYLQSSLKEFQKRTGLPITGNIDQATIDMLVKYGFKK